MKLLEEIIIFIVCVIILIIIFRSNKSKGKRNRNKRFNWNVFDTDNFKKLVGKRKWKHPNRNKVSYNKREEKCRQIFNRLFGTNFVCIRPDWLKNPKTGKNLELDGYNDRLRLAFEYQGQQHYYYQPGWAHRNVNDFKAQLERDRFKKARCEERGIALIRIPYTVSDTDLEPFIRRNLNSMGYYI